jgi:hypothetical protein
MLQHEASFLFRREWFGYNCMFTIIYSVTLSTILLYNYIYTIRISHSPRSASN